MDRAAERCNITPRWLVGAAMFFLVLRIAMAAIQNQELALQGQTPVSWRTPESVGDLPFKTDKAVLLWLTHGSDCPKCKNAEKVIDRTAVAKVIEEKFIPVKVNDPRIYNRPPEDDASELIYMTPNHAPCLVKVPPEAWNTERPAELSLWLSDNSNFSDTSDLVDFLQEECGKIPVASNDSDGGFGYVNWRNYEKALTESHETGKPLLIYFHRARDVHCSRAKARIFSDSKIAKQVSERFVPVIITNFSRNNKANSARTDELIAKYKIEHYPSIVVCSEGKQPFKTSSDNLEDVHNFLTIALE